MVNIFEKSFSTGPALTSLSKLASRRPPRVLLPQSLGPSMGSFLTRQALRLVGPLPMPCPCLHCFSYQIFLIGGFFSLFRSQVQSPQLREDFYHPI